ncbi:MULTISPECIES: ABC transporter substrate-binding protein [Clostridia]|uniref:ABC transporter substrate-binding protein n=1 Tax=Clostridium saudiense TaxID=1414720 RepID=A0ABS2FLN0_9CLOT|nr:MULTISPECIES: ABC transporter substrate-binding protein [Clostridiaceae]MBM6820882.1 ABC transporter substrate-binding protein [Clostridium saudiense]
MKKILNFIIVITMIILMISCNQENSSIINEEINARLISPDGLPSIAISKLIADNNKIENITLECSIEKTTDLLLSELMKGEADLAIVPSNLALQADKKDLGYKVAATIGWGSLYLVSTEEISNISELEGCEVYNTGKGLTPDIVFKNILSKNNVNEENIDFSYVGAASELAPLLISGQAKYAVVPEPVLSTVMAKNSDIKIILSLNDEWIKANNVENGYPQSTLLIKEEFYNKIKDTNAYDKLIEAFNESEKWVIDNPQLAAEKCEELGITVNKDVINESIKNSNLKFTKIEDSKEEYEIYFSTIDTDNKGESYEYDSIFIKK